MTAASPIRPRDRDTIIQALGAGVVPRRGQQHIQVGRHDEVAALVQDIDRLTGGGSSVRFVIGAYGSGKTFFLNLIRAIALEKKLVTAHADLTPERRLYSTGGHARSLYAELMRNVATRSKPEGGAVPSLVERFVTSAVADSRQRGTEVSSVIHERLASLSEMVGGYDFAHVVECYWRGHDTGDDQLKTNAIRWMRAEFSTRTDARNALGVRTIIDDANVYDQLKLLSRFVRLAGFGGLLVCVDEMVNLYKLANGRARNMNYEQVLRIVNDSLQGTAEGIGFLMGGTPDFLTDTRRGLYSYEALQSRLAENTFASAEMRDLSGPVIRLSSLSQNDLYILLMNIRNVFAAGDPSRHLVPDAALESFMAHCANRIGDAYFRTPRNTIKQFVHFLSVLDQNPDSSWTDLIDGVPIEEEPNPELAPLPEDIDGPEESEAGSGQAPDENAAARPHAEPVDQDSDDELKTFRL